MKKFLAESAIVNLALIAFLILCVYVEQGFGAQAKWTLFTIGLVAFSIYAWRKWRIVRLQQSDLHRPPGP